MKLKTLIFFLLFTGILQAQKEEPNWTRVDFEYSSRMYIDVNSIQNVNDTLISVWTMEENFPPLSIESVKGKIYKTKTFYSFNKALMKYSFFEIIYYDEKDNVLDSFSYRRNAENQDYQYNYPIIEGSIEEAILLKCNQFLKGVK